MKLYAPIAKEYVKELFANIMYADQPYFVHLSDVVDYIEKYKHLIDPSLLDIARAAGWLHDAIEDTEVSYSTIKKKFGLEIAEVVYALTNELGRNRKERSEKTYPKIKANKLALYVKLCDRLSNTTKSKEKAEKGKDNLFQMYKKEYFASFRKALYLSDFDEMFVALDKLYA